MKKQFFFFSFLAFFLFFGVKPAFAATISDVEGPFPELVPSFDGSVFYIKVGSEYTHVEYEYYDTSGSLQENDTYTDGVNMPSDRIITFEYNGRYKVHFYEDPNSVYDPVSFTVNGLSDYPSSGGSDDGGTSTPSAPESPDYTVDLDEIKSLLSTISGRVSSVISSLGAVYDNISSTNSALGSINSNLSNRLGAIQNSFNSALDKMDTSNSYLASIDSVQKAIRNELQTSDSPPTQAVPSFDNKLNDNAPSQNTASYKDSNTYFTPSSNITITGDMPQAPEPDQWEGVETPSDMTAENELSSDSELLQDTELAITPEMAADQMQQDVELVKEDMAADSELSKEDMAADSELTKDDMAADSELSKEDMAADSELTKDHMAADGVLNADSFSQTDQYVADPEMSQTDIYNSDSDNYNLRWKSVNGVFE